MKNILSFLSVLGFFLLASCSKLPSNGRLDGQWQLMEMGLKQDVTDSMYTETISKKEDLIYWRFQLDLLMIHNRMPEDVNRTPEITARFSHKNNHLDITSTYVHFRDRDSLLTDPSTRLLEPVGITGITEKFLIEKLDRKNMILKNDTKRLIFRKF